MRLKKTILLIGLLAPTLYACQGEQPVEPTDRSPQPISLQAEVQAITGIESRAATTFPNVGRISVIADATPEDWTNLYFNDMEAVTTDVAPTGAYNYTWSSGQAQYWPLNGSQLALLAYSAKSSAVVASGKMLNVTLPATNGTMPDLMYADGVKYGDKSLANRSVNFGMFRHAMSQLTVKLVTQNVGAPIVLNALSINTKSKATLDLTSGVLSVSSTNNITYSYPSQPVLTNATTYTLEAATGVPFLLYPDVAGLNNTTIYVRFTSGANTGNALDLEKTFNISDFLISDNVTAAKLERAKNIVLTITVKGTQILSETLTGDITPWVDKGEFILTIE